MAYHHVYDLEALLQRLLRHGGTQQGEIRDVGGGRRIVTLSDPDGNVLGLLEDA